MTENEEYNLAVLLIKNYIDKYSQYHINKLGENNIFWKKIKLFYYYMHYKKKYIPLIKIL